MAKILIVDDQKSVLVTLESILREQNHFVASATSAYDALEKIAHQTFDLMITDAMMPGGKSGFELIRIVRAASGLEKLPIILLTGKKERSDVQYGIEVGANEYVIKPIDPDILLAKVNSLLNSTGKHTETFVECQIRVNAEIENTSEVISVSEVGLKLLSNVNIAVNSKIKIRTELFDDIGIKQPPMRVTKCTGPDPASQLYTISVHFIGISEKEFQPIRLYVASKRRTSAA
jgi:DNA-binding response OmpR family regulator